MKHNLGRRPAKWGLTALCVLAAAGGACGDKDPGQPTPSGGTSGSGGSSRGGSGGQSAGSGGGQTGGSTGGGGGSTSNGGAAGDAAPGGETAPASGDYFPFAVGNTWEFDVTESGSLRYTKVQRIVRAEAVGGTGPHKAVMAFRLETRKAVSPSQADATVSWQARVGDKVVRYREFSCSAGSLMLQGEDVTGCTKDVEDHWDPPRVRIDEKPRGAALAIGMPWPEAYTEFKAQYSYVTNPMGTITNSMAMQTDTWQVKQLGASITTPAGTFNDCVVLLKTAPTAAAKTYTFCKGVGKVREEGAVVIEVLKKYTLK